MDIAILLPSNVLLKAWHITMLKELIQTPFKVTVYQLVKHDSVPEAKSKLSIINKLLFEIQSKIEKKIFTDCENYLDFLKKHDVHYLKIESSKEGFLLINHKFKSKHDVLINLTSFSIVKLENIILKHGIWYISFMENYSINDEYYGLREISNNEDYCTISLVQIDSVNNYYLLDSITKNWFWGFFRTQYELHQLSIFLIIENIKKYLNSSPEEILSSSKVLYINKKVSGIQMISYMFNFYKEIFTSKISGTFPDLYRKECWAVIFGYGNFLDANLKKMKPISMPKKVFWADPFLFNKDNKTYVFFENLSYEKMIGKISCGEVYEDSKNNFILANIKDVLVKEYHLSYPQIFEDNGEIFMIPETSSNNRVEVYKSLNFPNDWELYSFAFEGERISDTTYFQDEEGKKWLFLNKNNGLYIYQIEDLKFSKIIHHKLNPISMDTKFTRNAGSIFKHNNDYIRPNQYNISGVYGYGLRLSKISKLNLLEYSEEEIKVVKPNFIRGIIGTHHLHQLNNSFVFDVCYKKLYR